MTRTTTNCRFARPALTVAALATVAGLAAPAVAQKFQRLDGTDDRETSFDMEETRDGGSVTCGSVEYLDPATGAIDEDFYVIKHDKDGTVMWTTRYGGPARDRATSIHQTNDGGYIVAGHTESAFGGLGDGLALLRLRPDGSVVWAHAYEAASFEAVVNPHEPEYSLQPAVRESRTGDFIVVTNDRTTAGGQLPVYVRTDPAGFPILNVRYIDPARGLATFAGFTDLKELDDTSIAITGFWSDADPAPGGPPFIVNTDILAMRAGTTGAPLWVYHYGEPGSPNFFNKEVGYGIDVTTSADGTPYPFAIGGYAERINPFTGGLNVGTDHLQLDPLTGGIVSTHYTDKQTPSYAATLYNSELCVLTAGIDLSFAGSGVGVGPGAAEMLLPGLAGIAWNRTYGPFSGGFERLEGNAIMDRTCGFGFTGPKDPSAIGIGFGIDQLLVKTNGLGESGCFEEKLEKLEDEPKMEQIQMAFQRDPRDNWSRWGERIEWDVNSIELCYDAQCMPCPADINGDGIVDNGDIGAFVAAFLGGLPIADFNGDGIIDNGDITAFVAAYLAGC